MIYTMLQTISIAVYTAVSTAWFVEGKIPCREKECERTLGVMCFDLQRL